MANPQKMRAQGVHERWVQSFLSVDRAGGYYGAAKASGQPTSGLQEDVKHLEDTLGVQLFTTAPTFRLTPGRNGIAGTASASRGQICGTPCRREG